MNSAVRYCGREFTPVDIRTIRDLITSNPDVNRYRLSRLVCERLGWLRLDGGLKDMSCRVAMLRMQDDALIELPAPRKHNANGKPYQRRTPQAEPRLLPITVPAGALVDLRLELIARRSDSHLWNEYIDRYHYLGHQPLPGAQLRYFAWAGEEVIALLGFGAAAWQTAPRDRFIGWTPEQRKKNLHLIVNNARFLILPWVYSRNLASRLLAMVTLRLADDWNERYNYRPVLVETFVETPRFQGTCYKAANWIQLGLTQGRGKLGGNSAQIPKKSVWVRPLAPGFRSTLCN